MFLRNLQTHTQQVLFIFNAALEASTSPPAYILASLDKLRYTQFLSHPVPHKKKRAKISPSLSSTTTATTTAATMSVDLLQVKRTAAAELYLLSIIKRYLYRSTVYDTVHAWAGEVKAGVDATVVKSIIVIFMRMLYITHIILL